MDRFDLKNLYGNRWMVVVWIEDYWGNNGHWHPAEFTVSYNRSDAISKWAGVHDIVRHRNSRTASMSDAVRAQRHWSRRTKRWNRERRQGKVKLVKITAVEWEG